MPLAGADLQFLPVQVDYRGIVISQTTGKTDDGIEPQAPLAASLEQAGMVRLADRTGDG
jgi:hypothetical protein